MNKKRWALLVLAAILVFGYIKFFYKTYSESAVIKNADRIIVVDVKRITNTLIWQYITTPSQWKGGRLFPKEDDKVSWKDMFVLPDYVFAFHAKGQPDNAWYVQLIIKDKADFEKGLAQFQFEKINEHQYVSKLHGIHFLINDDKVLAANAAVPDITYLTTVADELFNKRSYTSRATLAKVIKAKSHLAVYIEPNKFLQKEAIVSANFNKHNIEISCTFTPGTQYVFTEGNFTFNQGDLFTTGFTQPSPEFYALLTPSTKEKISKALNANIDSVMLASNERYNMKLPEFIQRTDSAITYTFDDEFNKVEKVVINNIQEPAFNFTITGANVTSIYKYLQRNGKLEKTASGELFTPMPLVKSYCSLTNDKQLVIKAANYRVVEEYGSINAVLFLNIAVAKIPADIQKYLPAQIIKAISNIEAVKLAATKKEGAILLSAFFVKKNNGLPIIKF